MSSRFYCCLTFSLTAAGLVAVALLNVVVDPYGQYGGKFFPSIVQASRTQKLNLLEQLDEAPRGLVLGSSRVLKFEPSYLEEKTGISFFNAGVNHGRPTDFLALLRWYHARWGKLPEVVILGIDAVSMSPSIPLDARIAHEHRLVRVLPEAITWHDRFTMSAELLSAKQTRSSIESLASHVRKHGEPEAVEIFADDGKIIYRQREAERREGKYDFSSALHYNQREFDAIYKNFANLSMVEVERLALTIRWLRESGSQVYAFVTPFHPSMLPVLEKHPTFAERDRETLYLLRLLERHHGVHVVDLGKLASFDGDENEFVDGIHPLESNTRRMIDRLLEPCTQEGGLYAVQ